MTYDSDKSTEGYSRFRNQMFTSIDVGICWVGVYRDLLDFYYHSFSVIMKNVFKTNEKMQEYLKYFNTSKSVNKSMTIS